MKKYKVRKVKPSFCGSLLETESITQVEADELLMESNGAAIFKLKGRIVAAFAPGSYIDIQEIRE